MPGIESELNTTLIEYVGPDVSGNEYTIGESGKLTNKTSRRSFKTLTELVNYFIKKGFL